MFAKSHLPAYHFKQLFCRVIDSPTFLCFGAFFNLLFFSGPLKAKF